MEVEAISAGGEIQAKEVKTRVRFLFHIWKSN